MFRPQPSTGNNIFMSESGLYVVATPIGNLEDISHRAARVLADADVVAAEDTRRTGRLLRHLGLRTTMKAVHEHNEDRVVPDLLQRIADGGVIALVSDAGTPLISDPGYRLVRAARERGLPVHAVPGPSAVTAALSVSGLATDRFAFEGFPPAKAPARVRRFSGLATEPRTLVFFESSHRVADSLRDMAGALGADRPAAVCRELTKTFETVLNGTLSELAGTVAADPDQRKGEFVIVVAGCQEDADTDQAQAVELARALAEYLPASQAARVAAKLTGARRQAIYSALEA